MTISTIEEAKARARALRAAGQAGSHSAALELVAREEGARDWNTLSARLRAGDGPPFSAGQAVSGRYLSQPFTGRILSVTEAGGGLWRLQIRFDAPVDTVRFASFSNLRRQIRAEVGRDGRSPRRTSDGAPQLVLDL
ncbi:hypothetical protein E0K89_009650 [Aquicoccus sp. SCR17]|nr:hypothetical protein [Carideicomes alvinocaridis]